MTMRSLLTMTLAAVLAGGMLPAGAEASTGQVNINTATSEQLQLLPRVGPALAGRIIEFRETNGAFKELEELLRVRGVGERSFETLRPYLTVNGETTLQQKVRIPRQRAGDE